MKKYFQLCLVVLVVIVTFCQKSDSKIVEISDFPESKILKGVPIKEVQLIHLNAIKIIDSTLIILDKKDNYFFKYYNLAEFKLIGKYGKEGRGPGEFIEPNFTGEIFKINNESNIMQVYDWKRRRIFYIDIKKSISNSSYICESKELPKSLPNTYNLLFENDSILATIPDCDETRGRLVIYNFKNLTHYYVPFSPVPINGKIHKNNLYLVFATNGYCVNTIEQYFIVTPALIGRMDFFDFAGKHQKSIVLFQNKSLKAAKNYKDIQIARDLNFFQTDINIVNNEIYALYTLYRMPPEESMPNSKIYVFDSKGNAKREYTLDGRIDQFAVDNINHRFIGYSSERLDPSLVSYRY